MDAETKSKPPAGQQALGRPLTIEQRTVGLARVVSLLGSMQMDEAEGWAARLPAVATAETRHVVFDLTELEFINSVGISGIVATHRRAHALQGSVQLVNPRPAIRKLFELTRLDELVPIVNSVESALLAISGASGLRS